MHNSSNHFPAMRHRRLFGSLCVMALAGALSACAGLDELSADGSAAAADPAWSVPDTGAPLPTPRAPQAEPDDADDPDADHAFGDEPVLIRGNDQVVSPPSIPANSPARDAETRLNFEAAPVAQVVNVMLHDLLNVDYVVHPPLDGTITLTTPHSVSAERALQLLETALQANGIVLARDARGTYHVGAPEQLAGIISAPVLAEVGKPLPPGYGAVIIPLKYLGAAEMAKVMEPLIAPDAILRVDTLRNILVMRGTSGEAEGWLDLVKTFDVNLLRGMSVGIFPLKYTTAAEMEQALQLISGSATASAASALVDASAPEGETRRQRRLRQQAAQQQQGEGGDAGASAPAMGDVVSEDNPLYGALRVIPIERINAILVVTPRAAYLDEVRYWIDQLDRANINSSDPQLFVYKVRNSSAEHLAELLNGIYGEAGMPGFSGETGLAPGLGGVGGRANVNNSFAGQYGDSRSARGNASSGWNRRGNTFGSNNAFGTGGGFSSGGMGGGFGSGFGSAFGGGLMGNDELGRGGGVVTTTLGASVRVMADQINNTLLIHATPAEFEQIEKTLHRLDVQRAQVIIEASIIEITLGDNLKYGLQWAFNNGFGSGRDGTGMLGPMGGTEAPSIPSSSSAFTYTLSNSAGNISAVLSALAGKSMLKVISSPSLLVLDNHTAAIQVGTQEPVSTGTTISGSSNYQSTNIQYKDTGVMLGVTPSVSAGDLVTLDIDQIVSNIGGSTTIGSDGGVYPTFQQREINSKVAVRSGQTLVLGGLIEDRSRQDRNGVPLLSSIPGIGALFGMHEKESSRTELLVILTPRVLRSDEDARAVSRELRDRMRNAFGDGL